MKFLKLVLNWFLEGNETTSTPKEYPWFPLQTQDQLNDITVQQEEEAPIVSQTPQVQEPTSDVTTESKPKPKRRYYKQGATKKNVQGVSVEKRGKKK